MSENLTLHEATRDFLRDLVQCDGEQEGVDSRIRVLDALTFEFTDEDGDVWEVRVCRGSKRWKRS